MKLHSFIFFADDFNFNYSDIEVRVLDISLVDTIVLSVRRKEDGRLGYLPAVKVVLLNYTLH